MEIILLTWDGSKLWAVHRVLSGTCCLHHDMIMYMYKNKNEVGLMYNRKTTIYVYTMGKRPVLQCKWDRSLPSTKWKNVYRGQPRFLGLVFVQPQPSISITGQKSDGYIGGKIPQRYLPGIHGIS